MSQLVRPAVPHDQAAIQGVVDAAYAMYIQRIGKRPGPMLADYAALITRGAVHVLETGGGVDGVLVLVPAEGAMLLENVAVRPEAQNVGNGRKLLDFAEWAARRAGYAEIRLYTHQAMHENIARYQRSGFVETHRAREDGYDRVYMAKSLI